MTQKSVNDYCAGLYDRTRALWCELEGEYPTWKCRFSILYGPPQYRPDLFVLGRNPGYDPNDLYDEEILTWPKENEYTNKSWKLAAKLQKIFADADLASLLDRSVGTNQLFFKSKSIDRHETGLGWADNPLPVRRQLEAFCEHELRQLIRILEPKVVLALGLSVFDEFVDSDFRRIENSRERRIAAIGETNGAKVIGIIHPTGAQVSNADWAIICEFLAEELDEERSEASTKEHLSRPFENESHVKRAKLTRKKGKRQRAFRPDTIIRAANRPPGTYGYQPIHDFWHELALLGDVTVQDFHKHMVSTGWRRPQGGPLSYDVTRTDIACMCREGFATRV